MITNFNFVCLVNEWQSDTFDRDDVCSVCKGSEYSGPSLLCDHCSNRETHLHCLPVPIVIVPDDRPWCCEQCCKVDFPCFQVPPLPVYDLLILIRIF